MRGGADPASSVHRLAAVVRWSRDKVAEVLVVAGGFAAYLLYYPSYQIVLGPLVGILALFPLGLTAMYFGRHAAAWGACLVLPFQALYHVALTGDPLHHLLMHQSPFYLAAGLLAYLTAWRFETLQGHRKGPGEPIFQGSDPTSGPAQGVPDPHRDLEVCLYCSTSP